MYRVSNPGSQSSQASNQDDLSHGDRIYVDNTHDVKTKLAQHTHDQFDLFKTTCKLVYELSTLAQPRVYLFGSYEVFLVKYWNFKII